MQTIIGLGNPGKKYESTRHNIGFLFVEYLEKKLALPSFSFEKKHNAELAVGKSSVLLKPQTFMNESGLAVRSYLDYYNKNWREELSSVFVAHDDLDIAFGTYKIQLGKGPKIHNGLLSLYNHLHSNNFWHIRLGVDNRNGARTIPGRDYVLAPFTPEELQQLETMFADVQKDLKL